MTKRHKPRRVKRRSPAATPSGPLTPTRSCRLCGALEVNGRCPRCGAEVVALKRGASERELVRLAGVVETEAAGRAADPASPRPDGWTWRFDLVRENGSRLGVEMNEQTERLVDPGLDASAPPPRGCPAEVLGEVHERFQEAATLREAPAREWVVRSVIVALGQNAAHELSRALAAVRRADEGPLRCFECVKCGAIGSAPLAAPEARCAGCGRTFSLPARRLEAELRAPPLDETARQAALKADLERVGPALCSLPVDLRGDVELLFHRDPIWREHGLSKLKKAWEADRWRLANELASDLEVAATVGLVFADALALAADHLRVRGILESLLDLLTELDLRDRVRCRLARAALQAGDRAAAERWLEEVGGRSGDVRVHTQVLCTRALAQLPTCPDAVLELLGEDEILAPDPLVYCLRGHARAALRQPSKARREVSQAEALFDPTTIRLVWGVYPGPPDSSMLERTVELLRTWAGAPRRPT